MIETYQIRRTLLGFLQIKLESRQNILNSRNTYVFCLSETPLFKSA